MNKHFIYILMLLLGLSTIANAQKATKVFDDVLAAMDARTQVDIDNNMNKARINFDKILLKDSTVALANFGLAVIYSYDKYTLKDYFKGWHYFKKAEQGVATLSPEDKEVMNNYFFKQKRERRGWQLNKNMDIERNLVEEKLIKFVREENNFDYAEKFLAEFPDSKYYNNVIHIRNYIVYRTAENAGTVEAFNQFLAKYPNSAQFKIATEQRNALAYKKAQEANSFEAYKNFVDNYPEAIQFEEAKKMLGILAYDVAAQKHTLEAVEEFLDTYPNSPKVPDAKILKRQLLFEWAKKVNSLEAYNKFVAQYPEGEMFVDIFNLKSQALGQQILADMPADNYKVIRGFDNNQSRDFGGAISTYPNGNIIVIANTPSLSDEMDDVWLIKLDANGKMIKNDIVGNEFDDKVNVVTTDNNGMVYAAGLTNAIKGEVPGQSWFFKMSSQGKNEQNIKFEGNEVLAMALYNDGKLLMGGYMQDNDSAMPTPLITKLNAQGKKLWNRTYAPGSKVTSMATDGELCSIAFGNNWVAQIDALGYIKWDNLIDENSQLTTVALSNGKSIYIGKKDNTGLAIAFSADGKKLWETTFELPTNGNFKQSCALADGSVIAGGTFGNTMILVKIDANGNVAFVKNFETSKSIALNGLAATTDNSIWVSATYNNCDIVVFKLGL